MSLEELQAMQEAKAALDTPAEPEIKDEAPVETPEIPEHEKEARSSGWCPKEEWRGDPNKWVPADEFVRRGRLFDEIHTLKNELKSVKDGAKQLLEHNKKIEQATREKVLAELKAQRREAIESGDVDAVDQLDNRIQEQMKQPEEPEQEAEAPQNNIPEPIVQWAKVNPWFEKDQEMAEFMVFKQNQYLARGETVESALDKATADVKRTFAQKFENPNRDAPNRVDAAPKERGTKKSVTEGDLNEAQRKAFRAISRATGMTLNEYVEDLKKLGEIKS